MVDVERLHRILRRITDDLARLRAYAAVDRDALRDDEVRLGHVKYLFITTIEGCIDAAQHVCASEGFGPPDTNADVDDGLVVANLDRLDDMAGYVAALAALVGQ